ncbi:IucA/IucC family protein [Pseudomonas sp. RC10]|uniref:IucA/IucC family protein n=2 Tax=Pseudomonas bambusae TaxID=3139142 RepID=UPI00313A00A9
MSPLHALMPENVTSHLRHGINSSIFTHHRITEENVTIALQKSSQRALQRLTQAMLREGIIQSNTLTLLPDGNRSLPLTSTTELVFEDLIDHRMSAWSLGGRVLIHHKGLPASPLTLPSELLEYVLAVSDDIADADVLTRLSAEIDNSFMNDILCVAFHDAWSRRLAASSREHGSNSFLADLRDTPAVNTSLVLEQWGTTGHPWHPNYKTKLGLSPRQVIDYSPEFDARFEVILCAVHRDFIHIESLPGSPEYRDWLAQWFPEPLHKLDSLLHAQGLNASDYFPLPVHPWQASETLPSLFADELSDRLLVMSRIKAFTAHPTMSFRTVLPEASRTAPMVKLPVGLRLTSVQRTLSPRSACMGPRVSALLMRILNAEPEVQKTLIVVPECIGLHFKSHRPSDDRERHLSVLYRTNPNDLLNPGEIAVPVGSLFAPDHRDEPLLRQWILLSEGNDSPQAASDFLDRYLYAALPGLMAMYLLYGFAFEAHQQNSFMVMDVNGQPSRLLLRDFGDIRIDRKTLNQRGFDLLLKDPAMTLYEDTGFVRDKLLHTAFMCHFGELILLISRHWELTESDLWEALSAHVNCCFDDLKERTEPGRWHAEREALLVNDWPAKSFLRMRLRDSPIDIVRRLKNPLNHERHAR